MKTSPSPIRPYALVAFVAFVLGFGLGWNLALGDDSRKAAEDYEWVSRALAAENASLAEEIRLKDELLRFQQLKIDAIDRLAEPDDREAL
jgi:hypothetical protein